MMWDTRKVGKSPAVGIPTPVKGPEGTESVPTVEKKARGAGVDERSPLTFSHEDRNKNDALLSRISTLTTKKTLVGGLIGDTWGENEKRQRVHLAANFQGTLPNTVGSDGIRQSYLAAGGLLKEWN
jgi:hypothetical protein